MAGERKYMRIPPDSSGKRVALEYTAQITYQEKPTDYIWTPDEFYATSDGIRIFLYDVYESSSTTGILSVRYDTDSEYENQSPAPGTGIINLTDNAVVANVVSVKDVWYNSGNIVGASNPSNGLEVDNFGSANIRFSEGRPQLDAFGKLRVSGASHLGSYVFGNEDKLDEFSISRINNGNVEFDYNSRAIVLSVPGTPGAEARATTNTYHHYVPGSSHLWMGTAALDDPTAQGAIRNFGLFDEKNGLCFTINEQGVFGVTIRSSAETGSVVNHFIPQSDFNIDRVDGSKDNTNLSGMELKPFNVSIYWIDVQWHGAGRVRFGVFYQGQRVTMHEYYHGNRFAASAMGQTISLPSRYDVTNVSSASPLQIKSWSCSIWTEHDLDVGTLGAHTSFTAEPKTITAGPVDPLQPILAFSPDVTTSGGDINRRLYMPTGLSVVAYDSTTGEERLVDVRIVSEPIITGFDWVTDPGTNLQISQNITTFDDGTNVYNRVVRGEINDNLSDTFKSIQYGALKNYADTGGTRVNNIENITQASPAVVTVNQRLQLREDSNPVLFSNVGGMTQVNGNQYYIKPTGVNTAELYLDSGFTQPLNTTGFTAYTSGGTVSGSYGTRQNWVILARNLVAGQNTSIIVTISWKVINQ